MAAVTIRYLRVNFSRICLLGILLLLTSVPAQAEQEDLRNSFEVNYQHWKEHCKEVQFSSNVSDRLDSPYYEAIIALGPGIIPYIVEKRTQEPEFVWIAWAWGEITKVIPDPSVNPWAKEPILAWWDGGQQQANERFESLYTEWKTLNDQGAVAEADDTARSIRALGIAVLPPMVERLRQGDAGPLMMIRDVTDGAAVTAQVDSCLLWWENNKEKWIIPFPDRNRYEHGSHIKTPFDTTQGSEAAAQVRADCDELYRKYLESPPPDPLSSLVPNQARFVGEGG